MVVINQREIVDRLGDLTIKEMLELVSTLEAQWGVEAVTGGPVIVEQIEAKSKTPVQTEFDVVLVSFGHHRIKVIKALRELTGLGLREAVQLVSETPVSIEAAVSRERADDMAERLEEAGAEVSIE